MASINHDAILIQSRFTHVLPFFSFVKLGNASIVGRASDRTLRFRHRRWKRSRAFRGDVTDLWLLAKQCTVIPVTQRGQGSVERRRNGGAAKGSNSSVSRLRIRFLPLVFSQCFRVPYPNTAEKSQCMNGHQNRKWNFGRQSTISCAWKTGKEGQNACRKIQIEFVSKGRWSSDAVSEITKNRALAQAYFRRQIILNQSQRKARVKYWICTGFWFGSSWAQSQAVGRSTYIYIANDESPSQHVTVGLAEARPNKPMKQSMRTRSKSRPELAIGPLARDRNRPSVRRRKREEKRESIQGTTVLLAGFVFCLGLRVFDFLLFLEQRSSLKNTRASISRFQTSDELSISTFFPPYSKAWKIRPPPLEFCGIFKRKLQPDASLVVQSANGSSIKVREVQILNGESRFSKN